MKIKKKTAALLFACAWAIFALAAPLAFRAVTANAFSMDDVITVKVYSTLASVGDDTLCVWGTFYRGIEPLTEISYETDGGTTGTATIEVVDADSNFYTFTTDSNGSVTTNTDDYSKLVYEKPLDTTEDCQHNFIDNAGAQSWECVNASDLNSGHWAECSSCGFKIQVAHRPDGKGGCKDCNAELDGYTNTYTFSGIPDGITNNEDMAGDGVVFFEDGVAEFEIEVEANLFLGSALKLNLESENGELTAENGTTISYTIDINLSSGDGDATSSFDFSGPEEIWWYTAPTEYEDPDNLMTAITATITITLTVEPAYAGTFTDTLTFSVTLEQE